MGFSFFCALGADAISGTLNLATSGHPPGSTKTINVARGRDVRRYSLTLSHFKSCRLRLHTWTSFTNSRYSPETWRFHTKGPYPSHRRNIVSSRIQKAAKWCDPCDGCDSWRCGWCKVGGWWRGKLIIVSYHEEMLFTPPGANADAPYLIIWTNRHTVLAVADGPVTRMLKCAESNSFRECSPVSPPTIRIPLSSTSRSVDPHTGGSLANPSQCLDFEQK